MWRRSVCSRPSVCVAICSNADCHVQRVASLRHRVYHVAWFLVFIIEQNLYLPSGRMRFSKHSFRSTGAVVLSQLEIEVLRLQPMARCMSGVVLHYAREASLGSMTSQAKQAAADETLSKLVNKFTNDVKP